MVTCRGSINSAIAAFCSSSVLAATKLATCWFVGVNPLSSKNCLASAAVVASGSYSVDISAMAAASSFWPTYASACSSVSVMPSAAAAAFTSSASKNFGSM